jgi:hypothetical protein
MRYLLITFFRKPGGQIDEQVVVSKRVKTSDSQTCNVILDYAEKKVIKCVIESKAVDTDFERMNEYYKRIYPNLILQLEKEAGITAKENGA